MNRVSMVRFAAQGMSAIGQSSARAVAFQARSVAASVRIQSLQWTAGQNEGAILFGAAGTKSAAAAMLDLAAAGNVPAETMVAFDSKGMGKVLARTGRG